MSRCSSVLCESKACSSPSGYQRGCSFLVVTCFIFYLFVEYFICVYCGNIIVSTSHFSLPVCPESTPSYLPSNFMFPYSLKKAKQTTHSVQLVMVLCACVGHPLVYGQSTTDHSPREEWFYLSQQLLNANSSSVRAEAL